MPLERQDSHMNIRVDKAGRIVLPKPVRDRLGLKAGASLELSESADGLVLRPATTRGSLIKRNGRWRYAGKAPRAINWDRLIAEDRDSRIKELFER